MAGAVPGDLTDVSYWVAATSYLCHTLYRVDVSEVLRENTANVVYYISMYS